MNAQQAVYSILTALLPVLGIILPGFFKQDKLTPQQNGIIATIIVLLASAGQAWSQGQIHLVNPYLDFIIVLAGISSLLAGPFKEIDAYFQSNVGLGAKQPAPVTPAETQTINLFNSLISVLEQHGQVLSTLIPALQNLTATQSSQPAQVQPAIAQRAAQPPVYGPVNTNATNVQPSVDGVQTTIPAFTSTAEIPTVNKPA